VEIEWAGIDVAVVSWWGRPGTNGDSQGVSTDERIAAVLTAAELTKVKVAFHLEPYEGRSAESVAADVKYINEQYGPSSAVHRINEKIVFYVYVARRAKR